MVHLVTERALSIKEMSAWYLSGFCSFQNRWISCQSCAQANRAFNPVLPVGMLYWIDVWMDVRAHVYWNYTMLLLTVITFTTTSPHHHITISKILTIALKKLLSKIFFFPSLHLEEKYLRNMRSMNSSIAWRLSDVEYRAALWRSCLIVNMYWILFQ